MKSYDQSHRFTVYVPSRTKNVRNSVKDWYKPSNHPTIYRYLVLGNGPCDLFIRPSNGPKNKELCDCLKNTPIIFFSIIDKCGRVTYFLYVILFQYNYICLSTSLHITGFAKLLNTLIGLAIKAEEWYEICPGNIVHIYSSTWVDETKLATRQYCKDWQFKSWWSSDATCWQRSVSTLAQKMACCLTVPNHFLDQC